MEATATEMKNNFGQYLEEVMERDTDVVITRNGKKVARLTPYVIDVERYFTIKENAIDYVYGGKKISYEEYLVMNEMSSQRSEYMNGEVILMSSPNVMHQMIVNRISFTFQTWFQGKPCQSFTAPFDLHLKKKGLTEPDVVQPDLLVACDLNQGVNEKGRYMGTPALVVEILSESTRSRDMVDKLNSYMLSGINEYWIVDMMYNKIMMYEFKNAGIGRFNIFESGLCRSFFFEGLVVEVEGIFAGI
ncbi:MAG: prevent-host-death protein [Firmicutes bacterium HGW-Firmicutes-1]|jgi:prevent-host-death family protein|nr:MAG: prevent-host-death protein [Firmicutes bacterium HGW-Firmicutes-1]